MKAAFYTLGCKVNQYETELMAESLQKAGFEIVDCDADADVYVVNSCTVTAVSDQKSRQSLRALKRKHPHSIAVLAGCMSQAYPADALCLEEADIVIGNTEHSHLASLIESYMVRKQRLVQVDCHEQGESFESATIHAFGHKTRAEVKIEDGCNRYCSYCAIPKARGFVRSKPLESLHREVEALAASGYQEVVLVGINLSAYNDSGNDFAAAVHTAATVPGIERVRLGSLEPDHITEDVIKRLAQEEKLCNQFHISLQSGCDKTLKAMNRHYTAAQYKALCDALRAQFPDCSITTDLMVGFPGESQEDFECSYRFAQRIGFEKIHIFPYSPRKGTRAAEMPEQISKAVKSARAKKMLALAEQLRRRHFAAQVGKLYSVLFESKKEGCNFGYTKNYIPVKVESDCDFCGSILPVRITAAESEYCVAVLDE